MTTKDCPLHLLKVGAAYRLNSYRSAGRESYRNRAIAYTRKALPIIRKPFN